ncbi:uncharacterized protein LOC131684542 [Topomyia yanbarensis]|uniref:uncharacterized protein LOC131684542 n=1 Tax=Topomyia yanbarensis TaxID=2498891 RepID=UPI00273A7665|nr:uncharacterized protein LOC131684542 [Topomyia yanbarensis]
MPVDFKNKTGRHSDDEDEFFKPTSNSTLAKIFGISKGSPPKKASPSTEPSKSNQLSDRYGASSFRYVPPQETTDCDDNNLQNAPTVNWKLVQASVVSAYKLINTENVPQGKLGLALLCLDAEYRIIIYRTKADVLATLNISPTTTLILVNGYLQFHSDDGCFWSILFDQITERDELLKSVHGICTIDQEVKHSIKPIPASRTIPLVELPDSDVDPTKASLISRMARVGQSIYPQDNPVSTTEVSDSSDADVRIETIPRSSIPPHRRTTNSSRNYPVTIGMQMIPSAANALNTAISGQNMLQTANDVNINMFLTESRMYNTELRMNMSKIETKLERVLDRIDLINGSTSKEGKSMVDRDEDMLLLEEKMLEVKKENYSLKGKIRSLEAEAASGKDSITAKAQLIEAEKRCQELKTQVDFLQREVQTSKEKNEENVLEIDRLNRELMAKNIVIEQTTKDLSVLEEQIKFARSKESSLQDTNLLLMKELECLKQTIAGKEQKLADQSAEQKTNDSKQLNDMVKQIMNNCFQRISDQIDDVNVLKIVAQAIKQETKAVIQLQ